MKILFTGQRGFLGRELIPHLEEQGHDVTTSNIDIHYPTFPEEIDIKRFLYSESPAYINLQR